MTMSVTLHYLAQLKRFAGVGSESVEAADGSSLPAVLAIAASRHGADFRAALLDEHGVPRVALLFFVKDEQVLPAQRVKQMT